MNKKVPYFLHFLIMNLHFRPKVHGRSCLHNLSLGLFSWQILMLLTANVNQVVINAAMTT